MGRKIEETMLYTIINYTKCLFWEEVYAKYLPTSKTKHSLNFLANSELESIEDNIFVWEFRKNYLFKARAYQICVIIKSVT